MNLPYNLKTMELFEQGDEKILLYFDGQIERQDDKTMEEIRRMYERQKAGAEMVRDELFKIA